MRPLMKSNETAEVQLFDGRVDVAMDDFIDKFRDERSEDAFFLCDLGDVLRKCDRWQKLLPRVSPHYAVKCNDDPVTLEVMASVGLGFDCASKNEIRKVLDLGVDPARIIYANPCKQANHIKYAANVKVKTMTFDNLDELDKVKAICPDAKLVLRILPAEYKATCNLGIKFGAPQTDVPALLSRAKELDLNVIGVSFHVGSGCQEAAAFPDAVQLARKTFDEVREFGFQPYLLDIGGGFPGDDKAEVSFEEICAVLAPALDEHFPEGSGVEIVAEPGRYFVASAYTLATNVIAKRRPSQELLHDENLLEKEAKFMYYINDGVYGSFNCLLYDHAVVHPTVPKVSVDEHLYVSSVWGPTCDGLDCVSSGVELPELDTGDWLVFHNMGAYTVSASSNFNGMARPRTYYLVSTEELSKFDRERGAFLKKLLMPNPPPLLEVSVFGDCLITY